MQRLTRFSAWTPNHFAVKGKDTFGIDNWGRCNRSLLFLVDPGSASFSFDGEDNAFDMFEAAKWPATVYGGGISSPVLVTRVYCWDLPKDCNRDLPG